MMWHTVGKVWLHFWGELFGLEWVLILLKPSWRTLIPPRSLGTKHRNICGLKKPVPTVGRKQPAASCVSRSSVVSACPLWHPPCADFVSLRWCRLTSSFSPIIITDSLAHEDFPIADWDDGKNIEYSCKVNAISLFPLSRSFVMVMFQSFKKVDERLISWWNIEPWSIIQHTFPPSLGPQRPVVVSMFVIIRLSTVFLCIWWWWGGASLDALHRPAVPFAKCDQ